MPPHEEVRVYEDGVGDDVPVDRVELMARGNAAYVKIHPGNPTERNPWDWEGDVPPDAL